MAGIPATGNQTHHKYRPLYLFYQKNQNFKNLFYNNFISGQKYNQHKRVWEVEREKSHQRNAPILCRRI